MEAAVVALADQSLVLAGTTAAGHGGVGAAAAAAGGGPGILGLAGGCVVAYALGAGCHKRRRVDPELGDMREKMDAVLGKVEAMERQLQHSSGHGPVAGAQQEQEQMGRERAAMLQSRMEALEHQLRHHQEQAAQREQRQAELAGNVQGRVQALGQQLQGQLDRGANLAERVAAVEERAEGLKDQATHLREQAVANATGLNSMRRDMNGLAVGMGMQVSEALQHSMNTVVNKVNWAMGRRFLGQGPPVPPVDEVPIIYQGLPERAPVIRLDDE